MGGGRDRLAGLPCPQPPTQGLRDCACRQPGQPRAQKTGTRALAGGQGGQDGSQRGLGRASLEQQAVDGGGREPRDMHVCPRPGSTCWPGSLPPSTASPSRPPRGSGARTGTRSSWERGPPPSHAPSAGLPAAWMGLLLLWGDGEGARAAASRARSPRRAVPLALRTELWLGLGQPWTAAREVSLQGWGEALPCPPAGPGAPLQAARRPGAGWEAVSGPSRLPAGVHTQSQDKKILW